VKRKLRKKSFWAVQLDGNCCHVSRCPFTTCFFLPALPSDRAGAQWVALFGANRPRALGAMARRQIHRETEHAKGNPRQPRAATAPPGRCLCGAGFGRRPARALRRGPADPGTQRSPTGATRGQATQRPRAPTPSAGVPGAARAGCSWASASQALCCLYLTLTCFSKKDKKKEKEKKTEKSEKKEKNGLRVIQGIFLCGHAEFL